MTFVPARWLPDAGIVGGEASAALMRHEIRQLGKKRLASLHTLVDITGPCVVLGEQRDVSTVDDPVNWVREHVISVSAPARSAKPSAEQATESTAGRDRERPDIAVPQSRAAA